MRLSSINLSVKTIILLVVLKARLRKHFPLPVVCKFSPSISIFLFICLYLLFVRMLFWGGYLFIDELQQAVAPFLHAPGGGLAGYGHEGGGGGGGFDWQVALHPEEREGNQPNFQNPLFKEDVVNEPSIEQIKDDIRTRRSIHRRLGSSNFLIHEAEVQDIIDLKSAIVRRMGELNNDPFWEEHRLHVIRYSLQPSSGAESSRGTLYAKLLSLSGQNPQSSQVYKSLIKFREEFGLRYDSPRYK